MLQVRCPDPRADLCLPLLAHISLDPRNACPATTWLRESEPGGPGSDHGERSWRRGGHRGTPTGGDERGSCR